MQITLRLGRAVPFVLVTIVGLYLYHSADQFDFVIRSGRPGPDIWPKIILTMILLASLWGAVEAVLTSGQSDRLGALMRAAARAVGREDEAQRDLEAEAGASTPQPLWRPLAAVGALIIFVLGIGFIGFTLATFGLMFAIILLAGYKHPIVAAVIALIGTLAFFFVFQRVAYISLPLGVGPFKELTITLMALFGVR